MSHFYQQISRHYHQLFPAHLPQLDFLAGLAGPPPARVADVGSGTGEYVAALCAQGYDAYGLEVDAYMVQEAHDRHAELARRLIHGDMLELMDELRGPCALAYCIGNSLPHLASLDEVREAVLQMWDLTVPTGRVALQVVNFDRVLAQATPAESAGANDSPSLEFALPSLSAADVDGGVVELDRRYVIPHRRAGDEAGAAPHYLDFVSELRDGHGVHNSELRLLVLTRERMAACLPDAAQVSWHGDFAGAEWSLDSPATIAVLSR